MIEKLQLVENRYEELTDRSQRPDFYNDPKLAAKIMKELDGLRPVVTAFRSYRQTERELADLHEMLASGDDPEL